MGELSRREFLARAGALVGALSFPALARPSSSPAAVELAPATPESTWILVGEKGAPPFESGWHNWSDGIDPLRFRLDDGIVTVRGGAVPDDPEALDPIFRLPADCRPEMPYAWPWGRVDPDGSIRPRVVLDPTLLRLHGEAA